MVLYRYIGTISEEPTVASEAMTAQVLVYSSEVSQGVPADRSHIGGMAMLLLRAYGAASLR